MNLDLLVFGAHPDDVEVGCSGTMIDLADRGYRVAVADLTDAMLSTRGDQVSRWDEAGQASDVLQIKERFRLGFSEGSIFSGSNNLYEMVKLIRQTKPHTIMAPYWEDRHPDHIDASRLVHAAVFWSGVRRYGDMQTPHRPHRVFYYYMHKVEDVSLIVDITSTFDRKLKAIRSYKSQFLPQPGSTQNTFISRPEFVENIIGRARYYGSLIGTEYGEPFHMKQAVKVEDILAWSDTQGVVG